MASYCFSLPNSATVFEILTNSKQSNVSTILGGGRDLSCIRSVIGERSNRSEVFQKASNQRKKSNGRTASVTPIGVWDRFPVTRTIQQMLDTMERIMDDPVSFPCHGVASRKRRTPWEIREEENEYKLRFNMPGMSKKDVNVRAEENTLIIKAEKATKSGILGEEEGEDGWSPHSYGKYSKRIALPENVDMEKIKAVVEDGMLYITIPKAKISSKVVEIGVQ